MYVKIKQIFITKDSKNFHLQLEKLANLCFEETKKSYLFFYESLMRLNEKKMRPQLQYQ